MAMVMDTADLVRKVREQGLGRVRFAFADIDGVLRGKLISADKLADVLENGCGFCDVVFGWDCADQLYDPPVAVTGWQTGFPDQVCHIDMSTLRQIPWLEGMFFFLADFSRSDAAAVCPRTLLKKVAAAASEMGFVPRFAQEFEWFNFRELAQHPADRPHELPPTLSTGMFGYSVLRLAQHSNYIHALFDRLTDFGVPIEGLHTETGPGVLEAAIAHDSVLEAADKAVLFKSGVKEIAAGFGIMPSFMAKWNPRLPGCSGHLHQSLWDTGAVRNLFWDESRPNRMSRLMEHYLAGQLYCLPEMLPMYAPTVNSYKRLVPGAWAPTTVSWGFDNRTAAIRVLNRYEKATRIETRVPGSDSNPYLAMAAALASGLYGIRHELRLELPATTGNTYEQAGLQSLPKNLEEAVSAMSKSRLARDLFGDAFVRHFTGTRIHEWNQYRQSDDREWELDRYFEII